MNGNNNINGNVNPSLSLEQMTFLQQQQQRMFSGNASATSAASGGGGIGRGGSGDAMHSSSSSNNNGPMMLQHPALMGMLFAGTGQRDESTTAPQVAAAVQNKFINPGNATTALTSVIHNNMQNGITANMIEAAAANGLMDSTTVGMIQSRVDNTSTLLPPGNKGLISTSNDSVNMPGLGRGGKRKRTKVAPSPIGVVVNTSANNTNGSENISKPTEPTLGGVSIPSGLPPNSSTAMQVQVAAEAAAFAAAPKHQNKKKKETSEHTNTTGHDSSDGTATTTNNNPPRQKRAAQTELTPEERAKHNRDRNREHARSTRLRKKAYVNKLKELVEGLHAERSEEVRRRRVAIQQLADVHKVRRNVVRDFLKLHSNYDPDVRKWSVLLDESFWLKQPVTPYRSFRRIEIDHECRISRGIEAVIADSASMSVMVESIGSRCVRWMYLKREEFLERLKRRRNTSNTHLQHAISSLSSSTGSNAGSGSDEMMKDDSTSNDANKISSSSHTSESNANSSSDNNNDYHDYNAPSLPDPLVDASSSSSDNPVTKAICTDSASSSAEDDNNPQKQKDKSIKPVICQSSQHQPSKSQRLSTAPATPLPPFVGLGKKSDKRSTPTVPHSTTTISFQEPVINNSHQFPRITAYYHINEDDMLLTDDVLMCPFIFRSQDAVAAGACAECVKPGMIRAQFSSKTNKLTSLEMVYDSMGFMQQLERASGSEGMAQIVPNSLEMALSPNNCHEARVITLAKPPYLIVSINELWTKMTKYTQMEVEGRELTLLNGEKTIINASDTNEYSDKPVLDFGQVSKGRCACTVNVHYDKLGKEFIDFVCSYPLSNADDEVTHLLHIYKELQAPQENGDKCS